MIYAYTAATAATAATADKPSNSVSVIESYVAGQSIQLTQFVQDEQSNKIHWDKRKISDLLENTLKVGDEIVVNEASDLARSTLQVLELLDAILKKGVNVRFVRYNTLLKADTNCDTKEFISIAMNIESEFVTKRTTDALARRRAAGLPLGRPKGRKNKTRKLDKHRSEIKKYLELNINKASIAKLVGCHAQTLYNYLDDNDLLRVKSSETSSEK